MFRHKPYLLIMQTWYKVTKQILLVSIVILFILMIFLLGLVTVEQNAAWYSTLITPSIKPPGWLFIPIWLVLYLLVAISIIIVLNAPKKYARHKTIAIGLFIMNGILNVLYTLFFFGMKSILLAFIEQPLLIASVLLLIWCTHRFNKTAAYLLIPYLIWVCFATVLTGMTLFMN
jgi:translocator protein